jgi:hypothetical protein
MIEGQGIAQGIERAPDCWSSTVQRVSVDHRRGHVFVTHQLLDRADVAGRFEQMRREGMAQAVAGGGLGDSGSEHRLGEGPLDRALVEMASIWGGG